jgi:hypothetical protein
MSPKNNKIWKLNFKNIKNRKN